jgi:hypothetical protein
MFSRSNQIEGGRGVPGMASLFTQNQATVSDAENAARIYLLGKFTAVVSGANNYVEERLFSAAKSIRIWSGLQRVYWMA